MKISPKIAKAVKNIPAKPKLPKIPKMPTVKAAKGMTTAKLGNILGAQPNATNNGLNQLNP